MTAKNLGLQTAYVSQDVCLQTLNDRDDSGCIRFVQAGQFAIVQSLANAGTDSVAQSNPLIVQLQGLAAVLEIQNALSTCQLQSGECMASLHNWKQACCK